MNYRLEKEKVITFEFLTDNGFEQDEDLYWKNEDIGVEYNYYSEWMWFGKYGIPRVDSQKRFTECLNTVGNTNLLDGFNRQYIDEK